MTIKLGAYLAATAAAASITALGAGAAHADNIVLNQWYTGHFTSSGTPLQGGAFPGGTGVNGPVLPGGFADAIASPSTPWTITLSHPGRLTVTDVEISGDRFQLFDNGIAMTAAASPFTGAGQNPGQASPGGGLTSVPCVSCSSDAEDINGALGNADFSSATFHLHTGVNVITGQFLGVIKFGDMNFIAEAVPEPATWAIMLIGFGALGAAMRARRGVSQTAA